MTFFAWYVLARTEFGCGSTHNRRCNRSLKLHSAHPYLAFRMSSSSTKRSNVQCVGQPFSTPYTVSFNAFFTISKFSRPFGLFSKIFGPRARIMSSKSSSSPTRAPPSLMAPPSSLPSQPQYHHIVHCQTRNPFVHQALLNIGTGILWFRRRIPPHPRVNNNRFTMMNPHYVVLDKSSHNQM